MKIAYTNFTGGEVSGSLAARYDLSKFKSSCRHLENFIPDLHGPLRRRMGTYFLEDLGAASILLPFEFSSDPAQNYVLVMQEGKIRVAQKNGFVLGGNGKPVEMAVPYKQAQLYDISFAQSGDVVYLAHVGHGLRKIQRYGHTDWRIQTVGFTPSIAKPGNVNVNFSSTGGFVLRYKVAAVTAKGEVSEATLGEKAGAKHPNDWVVGDYATISWAAVAGAQSYLIYREEAGTYGLVGVGDGNCYFRDDKYMADTGDTPSIPQNPFVGGNNPGIVCFHQQRLILAAPALQPQAWFGSRTGNYEDFSKSRPVKDDDALEFTLASGRIDAIQWACAFGDLLLGTAGSEYKAIGSDQGTITPSSLNVREQSYWGSIRLRPLIIGNSVLHVQRQGSRVRDLFYSLERDGYAGNDLSVMASHLFDNYLIRQWSYQQSPGSTVWAVRDDGLLLVLSYLKEHDIWGWCRVSTQGKFRSVACTAGHLEDNMFAVVERTVEGRTKWYLERFMPRWDGTRQSIDDAFYVDCGLSYHDENLPLSTVGGLSHLEGCEVSILADGSPAPSQVVKNGSVDIPYAATTIHVGLAYRSLMCPQTPEADAQGEGSSLGRSRSYGASLIRLHESAGGKYGPDLGTLYELPFLPAMYGAPVAPFTGDIPFTPDTGFSPEARLWIAQDQPLPFTVVALVLDVDVQG